MITRSETRARRLKPEAPLTDSERIDRLEARVSELIAHLYALMQTRQHKPAEEVRRG